MPIMTEPTDLTCDTRQLRVPQRDIPLEIFRPPGTGPAPGILYLHEIYGLIEAYREDARELARRGYLVWLPDLYGQAGARAYCLRALVRAAGRNNSAANPLYREVSALLGQLRQDPACSGRLGMIGMCLTGGFVIQAAMRDAVEAPVIFHHSLGLQGAGIPLEEEAQLQQVQRLQGHWSRVDPFCPRRRRERLGQLLGERLETHLYNIPHGFRSLSRQTRSATLAWQRSLDFFDQHLGGSPPPPPP